MKKLISIFLILSLLMMAAAGCGKKPQEEESSSLGEYVAGGELPQQSSGQPGSNQGNNDHNQSDGNNSKPQQGTDNEGESQGSKPAEQENSPPQGGGQETKPDSDQSGQQTKPDSDQSGGQTPPAEEQDKNEDPDQSVESPEQKDYSSYIKVASYNVCRLDDGKSLQQIVDVLKEVNPDIVGLQEIDVNNTRSAGVHGLRYNQVEILAKELGYDYWYYAPSIEPWNNGSYGHGILSRYPIKKSENVNYPITGTNDHNRNYSRSELDVNGKKLVFYNTHLSAQGDISYRGQQLKTVLDRLYQDQYAVLTGDMNMVVEQMRPFVKTKKVTLLNGGDDFDEGIPSYPQGANSKQALDNIIVTDTMDYYWNEDTEAGVEVYQANCSDHNLIYSYIQFK